MTTQKLLNNQKEMIESYETAFSHFPHHDTTVHIIVWSPFLLEIIYCIYIIYLSFQPEIPTIVSHTAVYFPLYLTIYGLFPILFPSFCAITLIIELNRYHALLTVADCRTLLKKLKEQTELAIKILTSDTDNDDFCYSFQNILFADDIFSTCSSALEQIRMTSSTTMRILHWIRKAVFLALMICSGVLVCIPVSIETIRFLCSKFSILGNADTYYTVFIWISIVICFIVSVFLFITVFAAQEEQAFINPLIFIATAFGAIILTCLLTMLLPVALGLVGWILNGIFVLTNSVLTALFSFFSADLHFVGILIVIILVAGCASLFS